jgi:hypothetical protein
MPFKSKSSVSRRRVTKRRPRDLLAVTRSPNANVLANLSYSASVATDGSGNIGWVYSPGTIHAAFDYANYASTYIMYRLLEYRVNYIPNTGGSTPLGYGSGLAGASTLSGVATGLLVPTAPVSITGVIQFCADYKSVYARKPHSITVRSTRPNQLLWYPTTVAAGNESSSQVIAYMSSCTANTTIGKIVVQFVAEFARS